MIVLGLKLSRPKVPVVWVNDDKKLKQNKRVIVNNYDEGINVLIIKSATYDDSGIYKVMFKNNHKLLSSATVKIDFK